MTSLVYPDVIKTIEKAFSALPGVDPTRLDGVGRDLFITAGNPRNDLPASEIKILKKRVRDIWRNAQVISSKLSYLALLPLDWRAVLISTGALEEPDLMPKRRRGKPNNVRAENLTKRVAWHYERLTGKLPTVSNPSGDTKASGKFIRLLGAIFAALEMEASAESQARAFVASRKKNKR